MSFRKLLGFNPDTGTAEYFHHDGGEEENAVVGIERVQDVQDIVDVAKRRFNDQKRSTPYGEFAKVASVPLSVLAELQRLGIADDDKQLKAWLNDPDNCVFRTRPGKV